MKKNSFIKLCIVGPKPPPYGGIANWVVLLERFISQNRPNIDISIINIATNKRNVDGRNFWDDYFVSSIKMFRQLGELCKLIQTERPTIIHITTSAQKGVVRDILILSISNLAKIPSIYHIRCERLVGMKKRTPVLWKLISLAIKMSGAVIAIEQKTYNLLCEEFPNKKIELIGNPIDISEIPSIPRLINSKKIMYLGWVIPTKGISELLQAWENIVEEYNDWELIVVGPFKQDYLNELANKISLKNVIYIGETTHRDALELLAKAEIFVLPSYTEGFPNVILEAMALSKAIIASNVGAIPDLLSNDCGLIVPSKSINELQLAIIDLINDDDKRRRIGQNARNKLVEQYTIENIITKYENLWSLE